MTNLEKEKHWVTDSEIASRVQIHGKHQKIIVGVGPSRSGTTLCARIFSEQGIKTWYQPFKSILRGYNDGINVKLQVPNEKTIFIKETFGAYTENETKFNPIDILLLSGVPKNSIYLISIVREPFPTAISCLKNFSKFPVREDIIKICLLCYESIYKIDHYARNIGINTTAFAYEVWRDYDTIIVLEKLFGKLKLHFSHKAMRNWKPLSNLQTELKNMYWLPESSRYYHTDFFERVRLSSGICYAGLSQEEIKAYFTKEQMDTLSNSNVFSIYRYFWKQCLTDLSLAIDEKKV